MGITIDPPVDRAKQKKWINFFLEAGAIFVAILIGIMVRNGLYESMVVTSGSMKPTMAIDARFLVDHRSYLHGHWQRGDIVTFKAPESWGGDDTLVKRIIGLPGETLYIKQGTVYIDNRALPETYIAEQMTDEPYGPIKLGDDQYFVMGDNRNNSDDSRANGPIRDSDIRGRVVMRLWPFSDFGRLPAFSYGF